MSTVASDKGGDFKPVPPGNYMARCVRVIDLGTQPGSQMYPKPAHKILIAWELPEVTEMYEGEEQPRLIMSRYTLSLHENANLRSHLESWRGRPFTPEERKAFDIAKLLGVPCQLQVVHSDDGKYANVKSISALHAKLRESMAPAFHSLIHYQIEDGESDAFNGFSDNLKATIRKAEEWAGERGEVWGEAGDPGHDEDPGFDDSDIPF